MNREPEEIADLDREQTAKFIIDMLHRTIMHYAQWFHEVEYQMGAEKALGLLGEVFEKSLSVQMERFSKLFGFELQSGLPKRLLEMPKEKLDALAGDIGKNWLAGDGIWFQAVERTYGMNDAKRCNDSCWGHFSPFEAWSIKRFLGLGERPGLEGLRKALRFRMYALINVQSIVDDGPGSIIFRMNDCRVQSARKRKGLADYPCKSAGLVEYTRFAEAIDPRIRTECVGCPPDTHPDEWFCAWRFTLS